MSEHTAQFLARLSHQWQIFVLPLPILFGAVMYGVGVLQSRARDRGDDLGSAGVVAARWLSVVLFVISIGVAGVSFFHVGCAALRAHGVTCYTNEKALALAVLMYAQDNDERMPPTRGWANAIQPQVGQAIKDGWTTVRDPWRCPAAETPGSYGINRALEGITQSKVEYPANTVLLFEVDAPARSFAGGVANVDWHRRLERPNFAFFDGHVKGISQQSQQKLAWARSSAAGSASTRRSHDVGSVEGAGRRGHAHRGAGGAPESEDSESAASNPIP